MNELPPANGLAASLNVDTSSLVLFYGIWELESNQYPQDFPALHAAMNTVLE
jgi:hypothetical protein